MDNGDKIFKFLQKCNTNCHKPDLHSFTARINGGIVYVECRGYDVYIESQIFDKKTQWVGTTVAAANRLEMLGIEFDTIDM